MAAASASATTATPLPAAAAAVAATLAVTAAAPVDARTPTRRDGAVQSASGTDVYRAVIGCARRAAAPRGGGGGAAAPAGRWWCQPPVASWHCLQLSGGWRWVPMDIGKYVTDCLQYSVTASGGDKSMRRCRGRSSLERGKVPARPRRRKTPPSRPARAECAVPACAGGRPPPTATAWQRWGCAPPPRATIGGRLPPRRLRQCVARGRTPAVAPRSDACVSPCVRLRWWGLPSRRGGGRARGGARGGGPCRPSLYPLSAANVCQRGDGDRAGRRVPPPPRPFPMVSSGGLGQPRRGTRPSRRHPRPHPPRCTHFASPLPPPPNVPPPNRGRPACMRRAAVATLPPQAPPPPPPLPVPAPPFLPPPTL